MRICQFLEGHEGEELPVFDLSATKGAAVVVFVMRNPDCPDFLMPAFARRAREMPP
jgi:hypothetical protein